MVRPLRFLHILLALTSRLSRKCSHATPSFTPSHTCIYAQARRLGAIVATDKKLTAGGNKAHQGMSILTRVRTLNISHLLLGTDHQRIAKLDRENEVAPPPKLAPSVGRVGRALLTTCACLIIAGYPRCSSRTQIISEGCRSENQREAFCNPRL